MPPPANADIGPEAETGFSVPTTITLHPSIKPRRMSLQTLVKVVFTQLSIQLRTARIDGLDARGRPFILHTRVLPFCWPGAVQIRALTTPTITLARYVAVQALARTMVRHVGQIDSSLWP
jgi:hypothetical protein